MSPEPAARAQRLVQTLAEVLLPAVLAGDVAWLARLKAPGSGIAWSGGEMVFTLPALYRVLHGEDDEAGCCAFMSALYRSDLNARLRLRGAAVVVHRPHRAAAQRRYLLTRLPPTA